MTNFQSSHNPSETVRDDLSLEVFGHPDDVLIDSRLSVQEKRSLLASWASDANALPHLPTLRQLPDGSIVKVDEILSALKALDGTVAAEQAQANQVVLWQKPFNRRRGWALRKRTRSGGRPDDDDDPPPCPAIAAVRPRSGGGASFVRSEPIYA